MIAPLLEPLIAVLIPFAGAIPIAWSRKPKTRNAWSFLTAGVLWVLIAHMAWGWFHGDAFGGVLFPIAPGIDLAFNVDGFGLTFALVSSTLWVITTAYSIGYADATQMPYKGRFFSVFAICIGSAIGIALAANLFTLVIFYEILTIATYPLVVHSGTPKARRAGRLYLCYALTAGALLVGATAWSFILAGHVNFTAGGFLPGFNPVQMKILFVLFAMGFGVKAGVMPLHTWLPIAMIAPTPVSALLHAVAVVKAGVFGYLRLIYFIFGPELMRESGLWLWTAGFAAFTILVSSLIALRQDVLKRRLAYSTIGHLSYIILGAAMLLPAGQIGSLMHLANHAMMKITLFFCAGAIYTTAHRDRVSQLRGLGWQMPWTFGAFAVGALGLTGIPLFCGFISKWWLVNGALAAGQDWAMVVLLISGVLNAAYLLPVVTIAFDPSARSEAVASDAPLIMRIPLLVTAAMSILFGMLVPFITQQIHIIEPSLVLVGGQ